MGERASASVEFALVLPLVLMMALAVLEIGLLAKDQLVLQGSARAGAREAAVQLDDESVRRVVLEASAGLDAEHLEVAVSREGEAGAGVTVTVTYRHLIDVPLVEWLFPPEVGLSASATMRQEV